MLPLIRRAQGRGCAPSSALAHPRHQSFVYPLPVTHGHDPDNPLLSVYGIDDPEVTEFDCLNRSHAGPVGLKTRKYW